RLRKRIRYRNSFQNYLIATMRPEQNGAIISGKVAMHPFVRVFMFIRFSGVILIDGSLSFATLRTMLYSSTRNEQSQYLGALIPVTMLCFGYALGQVRELSCRG